MTSKETEFKPQTEGIREASDAIAKQGPKNKGKKVARGAVFLPQNTSASLNVFDKYRYERVKANNIWGNPEVLLAKPTPGCHYGWASVNEQDTETRIATGLYRPVEKSELKVNPLTAGSTHKGTDKYVHRYSTILVEFSPEAWDLLQKGPEIESIDRLARRQEQYEAEVENMSGGGAVGKFNVSKHGTE